MIRRRTWDRSLSARAARWLAASTPVWLCWLAACGEGRISSTQLSRESQALLPVGDQSCPVVLDGVIDCNSNENCPCGSYCLEIVCTQDCTSDMECPDGGVCSDRGRCMPPASSPADAGALEDAGAPDGGTMPPPPDVPPPPDTTNNGTLAVAPLFQHVVTTQDVYALTLAATGADIAEVHVLATEGTEVRCAANEEFAHDCFVSVTKLGPPRQIHVRIGDRTPPPAEEPARRWTVQLFNRGHMTVADFELAALPKPAPEVPVAGVYRGTATLLDVGPGDLPTSVGSLQVPLVMRVYASGDGKYDVLVEDPWGAFSSAPFAGSLQAGDEGFAWATQAFQSVGKASPLTHEASVQMAATGLADLRAGAIEISQVVASADVLGPFTDEAIQAHWQLSLRRESGLPAGETFHAPVPPPVRSEAQEVERVTTAMPWSTAALKVLGPPKKIFEAQDQPSVHTLLAGWRSDPDGLLQCEWDTSTTMGNTGQVGSVNMVANTMCAIRYEADIKAQYGDKPLYYRTMACIFGGTGHQCANRSDCALHAFDPFYDSRAAASAVSRARRPPASWGTLQKLADDYGCTLTEFSGFKSCRIPAYELHPGPARCAQRYACYQPSSSAYTIQSSEFGATVLPASGDLGCTDGRAPTTFGLLANADLEPSQARNAAQMLAACLTDLTRPVPANIGVNAASASAVFATGGCIDQARVHRALDWASRPALQRAQGAGSNDAVSDLLAHRLVQQWLTVHMFTAREGKAQRVGKDLLADLDTSSSSTPAVPTAEQLLSVVEAGLELVLHPRLAATLNALHPDVLANPDYRGDFGADVETPEAHHEQTVGVGVTLLEALASYLELAESTIEREAFDLDGLTATAKSRIGKAIRLAVAGQALAAQLHARAEKATADIGWETRWAVANGELRAALSSLTASASDMEARRNPLGIEDSDLPLYFETHHTTGDARFRAISSYVLEQRAMTALNQARGAQSEARSSYLAMRSAQVQDERDDVEHEARLQALSRDYGRGVIELCGPRPGVNADNVMSTWTTFDPNSCFLDTTRSACVFDRDAVLRSLDSDTLRADLCRVAVLRKSTGLALSYSHAELDDKLDVLGDLLDEGQSPAAVLQGATFLANNASFRWGNTTFPTALLQRQPSVAGLVTSADLNAARARCDGHFANGAANAAELVTQGRLEDASCYLGTLGQDALALRASEKDVRIARTQFAEHLERYDIAKRGCLILESAAVDISNELELHDLIMDDLIEEKRRADELAALGNAISSIGDFVNPAKAIFGGIGGGMSLGAAINAASIEASMRKVELSHQAQMERIRQQSQIDSCYNDADQHLVGLRSSALMIDRAVIDLTRAAAQLENHQRLLTSLVDEADAVLTREENRVMPTVGHDFWLGANLKDAEREMRLARRAAFLAARAVAWEMQESSMQSLYAEILLARTPNELDEALEALDAFVAWRKGPGGGLPENLWTVLSLRDQILRVADLTDIPGATASSTPTERFRLLLRSPRFATFDRHGAYLGQRIPFSLSPTRDGAGSEAIGVAGFSQDCAERLWGVNALLVGPSVAGTSSTARVSIEHQNNFYSKWCIDPHPENPSFQTASTRPQRNLFRDPILGSDVAEQPVVDTRFAVARVTSHLNTPMPQFESEGFTSGESVELATRGLYGEYALVIPKDSIDKGLDIDRIEDVLLRFDYVSVARPSNVGPLKPARRKQTQSARTTTELSTR